MSGTSIIAKISMSLNEYFFANSEDPYEMRHNAAFHQGLHCKGNKDLQIKEYNMF